MRRLFSAALLGLAVAACSDDTGENISGLAGYEIVSVTITPGVDTIFIPDTVRASDVATFRATAIGRTGAPTSASRFVWRTSDPSIAVVDSLGEVRPLRPGTVEISASAHKVGKAVLVILPATNAILLSPRQDTVFVDDPVTPPGNTTQFTATALDAQGTVVTGVRFEWGTASSTVAQIDSTGLATGLAEGTTVVTVESAGLTAEATLLVLSVVGSVDVTSPFTQRLEGDTLQLAATALDYKQSPISRTFTWTSSAPGVATIDASGRAIFVGTGTVTFTARTGLRGDAVTVTVLPRRIVALDAGGDFNCGFAELGRGYCWGLNEAGQLTGSPQIDSACFNDHDLTRTPPINYVGPLPGSPGSCRLEPMRTTPAELEFTSISAGGAFACAVVADGTLRCWGDDSDGQCGNGLHGCSEMARVATVLDERFTTVSAGNGHACALSLNAFAYCWGADSAGQLGDTLRVSSTTPIPVRNRDGTFMQWSAVSAGGAHTCALSLTGAAFCWGHGQSGQRGDNMTTARDMPVAVNGGLTFTQIAAGGHHTCAIASNGTAWCWGSNSEGQLGIGNVGGTRLVPTPVTGATTFTRIAAGERHTCGIASSGSVLCWGMNGYGQVGNGVVGGTPPIPTPSVVGGITATAITVGRRHTCAIATTGDSFCWGSNIFGALGNGLQAAMRETPQLVARPR